MLRWTRRGSPTPRFAPEARLPGSHQRLLVTALVAGASTLTIAAPASAAITRGQAEAKALKAIGAKKSSAPLIVFRLSGPLGPKTRIAEGGLASANASGLKQSPKARTKRLRNAGVRTGTAPVVARVGRHRAWFFYADRAPFKAYQHAGQVVLVDAKSGKVTKTRTLQWPPLIDG